MRNWDTDSNKHLMYNATLLPANKKFFGWSYTLNTPIASQYALLSTSKEALRLDIRIYGVARTRHWVLCIHDQIVWSFCNTVSTKAVKKQQVKAERKPLLAAQKSSRHANQSTFKLKQGTLIFKTNWKTKREEKQQIVPCMAFNRMQA